METREKFEALPKIKKIMEDTGICYCDASDHYTGLGALYATIGFVNGAWYALQEQEKKIDEANKMNQKMMNRVIELSAELEKLENRMRRME